MLNRPNPAHPGTHTGAFVFLALTASAWALASSLLDPALVLLVYCVPVVLMAAFHRITFGLFLVVLGTITTPILGNLFLARVANYFIPLLVIGIWLLHRIAAHRIPRSLPQPLAIWFGLFLFWTLFTALFADMTNRGIAQFGRYMFLAVTLHMFWDHWRPTHIHKTFTAYTLVLLVISGFGIYDAMTNGIVSITSNASGLTTKRFTSLFSNPNILGVAMGHGVVLLTPRLFLMGSRISTFSWWIAFVTAISALFMFWSALFLTFSRASLLYAVAATATLAICHRRIRITLTATVVIAATLLMLLAPGMVYFGLRLGSGVSHRTALWDAGWEMMMDHPATGIGPGLHVFEAFRPEYLSTADHRDLIRIKAGGAHNVFLTKGAEMGVVGLILTVSLFAIFLSRVPAALRDYKRGDWLAGAAAAGMVGLTVRGIFESSFTLMAGQLYDSLLFFLFGLILLGRNRWASRE